MEQMQKMAQMYLDLWEAYWEQTFASMNAVEDMQQVWASFSKTYEDVINSSPEEIWK